MAGEADGYCVTVTSTPWMSAKESRVEWIIVGSELGVALVIAVAVYINMKK